MDNMMVLDEKEKRRIGMICFIPLFCFIICFIYYLILLIPLTQGHPAPSTAVSVIVQNYNTLFFMLAASAIITAPIFIYCLVLLARMKHMNGASKVIWIVFLSACAPIASVLFWYFIIKKEHHKYIPMHPDMA